MRTRKARRIAIATVLAVIAIAGALIWLGREHIEFMLASESSRHNAQRDDATPGSEGSPTVTEFRARKSRMS